MSITSLPTAVRFTEPAQLCDAMAIPFSDEQLAAITAPLGPGVIIAGAGSGKTTVMAARVVWLVGTGVVRPDQVLGLTFTRKAAAELAERVRNALGRAGVIDREGVDDHGEEVVMTYDAFAGRLVREHGLRIGADEAPLMITEAARYRLASRVVTSAPGPFQHLSRLRPPSLTERVLALDAQMSAHLVDPDQIVQTAERHEAALAAAPLNNRGDVYASVRTALAANAERVEMLQLVDDYRALKRRLGVTEFADQMAVAAALVEQVPVVGELLRRQFAVVLLDEYQDTSSAQAQLLRGLFGGGHPVTAVGDPFQAIYGWRGAAASNILAFHRDFPRADGGSAARYQLTVNRRSGHTILAVANEVASELRDDPVLLQHDPSGTQTPKPLVPPEDAPAGVVRAASFHTWPEEVAWIADRVVAQHQAGEIEAWRDVAVLVRRNAHLGALHQAFSERDVPVEIVGLGGLLATPEVAEVVSTLRLVDDVTANPDAVRLLQGPRWRIGARDLALLGRRARELAGQRLLGDEVDLEAELAQAVADTDPSDVVSLVDALADPGDAPYSPEALARFADFHAELTHLRRHVGEPVLDQVRRVIAVVGVDAELDARPDASRQVDQLATFTDAVASYVDVDGDSSLTGLLAWFQAELDHGTGLERATPTDRNSVKLLTVHRAKGLEWPVVHVPALVEGVFPSDRVTDNWVKAAQTVPAPLRGDADSIDQLTEASERGFKLFDAALKSSARLAERRLAYVAFTRAKRELVVSTHRWQPGLKKPKEVSDYFTTALAEAARQGTVDHEAPVEEGTNPHARPEARAPWPVPAHTPGRALREEAAAGVRRALQRQEEQANRGQQDGPAPDAAWVDDPELSAVTVEEAERIALWDASLDTLLAEARERRSDTHEVEIPASLSATALMSLRRDPQAFAADVVRPMPRPASRAAHLGTLFHGWVQQRLGQDALPTLLDEPDDLVHDHQALARLVKAFEAGPWAHRRPLQVEVPFVMVVGGSVVRGQIDAVYPASEVELPVGVEADVVVVDWKTSSAAADPTQLAIYRAAWAEATGTAWQRIAAAFVHVSTGVTEWASNLPTPEELSGGLTPPA